MTPTKMSSTKLQLPRIDRQMPQQQQQLVGLVHCGLINKQQFQQTMAAVNESTAAREQLFPVQIDSWLSLSSGAAGAPGPLTRTITTMATCMNERGRERGK